MINIIILILKIIFAFFLHWTIMKYINVIVNIGNEDIIIAQNFDKNRGEINFPFESFDIYENDKGYEMFKNINNQFDIFEVEIYRVYDTSFG